MPELEPEVCNCAALRQAARRVTKLYDDALAPTRLGENQYSILSRLSHVGPSTIQALAQLLVMVGRHWATSCARSISGVS